MEFQARETAKRTVVGTLPEDHEIPLIEQLSFKVVVGVVCLMALVVAASYFALQTRGRAILSDQAETLNREIGQKIVLKLGERVAATESLARSLSRLARNLPKDPELYRSALPALLELEDGSGLVAGGGIWPEPGEFQDGVERRSFFWSRDESGQLVYYDDYNDPAGMGYRNEEWYVPARYLSPGQVFWSKSYMDPYSFVPMVTCTAPYWIEGRFAGVATVDLRLQGISEFMKEEAKSVGGYAFAVDRNNKLLSFPAPNMGKVVNLDQDGRRVVEYLDVGEVAPDSHSFGAIVDTLDAMSRRVEDSVSAAWKEQFERLASRIDQESYQISEDEAKRIASTVLQPVVANESGQQLRLEDDFLLGESSFVSVFTVPSAHWKVVIAMPAEYLDETVSSIAGRVTTMMLVIVMAICALIYLMFDRLLLSPVRRLKTEVRKLALQEDTGAKLEIESRDELGRLAYWFNARTSQLDAALGELKSKNEQLEDARKVAETASRSKNVFLASMSHEIRTPMNGIIGLTAILRETPLTEEQSNFVNTIKSSSESLLSLINDILDYSKIEANELDLESIPFDLRSMLEDLAGLISFQAEEKGLRLSCYLDHAVDGRVVGDPTRLRQILLNLASNAIKFTESGNVDIWGTLIEEDATTALYAFSVVDTGIGIPKAAFGRLFESFNQVDSSTTRKYGGTGLGLAICKRMSEKMGGGISVESEVGSGSRFSFTARFAKDLGAAAKPAPSGVKEPLGFRLILADSEAPHGTMLHAFLSGHFPDTVFVQGVEELEQAIDVLKSRAIVVVGEERGRSDGSLVRRALEWKRMRDIRVVYFANSLRSYLLDAGSKAKIDGFIPKPFQRAQTLACLYGVARGTSNQALSLNGSNGGDASPFVGVRALMVEDNAINQKVGVRLLKQLGVECDIAADGGVALELARSNVYDVILMDWQMPVMDGLEATRRIREMPGWQAEVPIIALTANAMQGDRERCLDAGMSDYLSKPVSPDRLRETLGRWLMPKG